MNKLEKLGNYLEMSKKLEKAKNELAPIKEEIKKLDTAIEVMGDYSDPIVNAMCERWDRLTKKAAIINYRIAVISLEIAKYELDEAFEE